MTHSRTTLDGHTKSGDQYAAFQPAFLCSATQTVGGSRQINKRTPQFLADALPER